jgi:hypothetical protein
MEYLDNGTVKVGVQLEHGGRVASFLDYTSGQNAFAEMPVPLEDAIIVSCWGDPLEDPGETPWNPNQSDSETAEQPVLEAWSNDGTTLYTRTIPAQFAYLESVGLVTDMRIEQWLTLHNNLLKVRHKITYTGPDRSARWEDFPPMSASGWDQEAPFIGSSLTSTGTLKRYEGASPWTNAPLTSSALTQLTTGLNPVIPDESWVAAVNDSDFGLGVYAEVDTFNVAIRVASPAGRPLLTPVEVFNWTTGAILEYTRYLTLGSIEQIRSRFYDVHNGVFPLGVGNVSSVSAIESVALVLTHGELSIEASTSPTSIDIPTIVRAGGEFTIEECSSFAAVEMVVLVQSYGILTVSDCAAASAIATPTISLTSNGLGIRSPSGTSYTPRSITGEQLTIRRYSNGAWT